MAPLESLCLAVNAEPMFASESLCLQVNEQLLFGWSLTTVAPGKFDNRQAAVGSSPRIPGNLIISRAVHGRPCQDSGSFAEH